MISRGISRGKSFLTDIRMWDNQLSATPSLWECTFVDVLEYSSRLSFRAKSGYESDLRLQLTDVLEKRSSRLSNLSPYSSQSPPICLQNVSASRFFGSLRSKPGAGIRLTHLMRIFGVLNLWPLSVFPVNSIAWWGISPMLMSWMLFYRYIILALCIEVANDFLNINILGIIII